MTNYAKLKEGYITFFKQEGIVDNYKTLLPAVYELNMVPTGLFTSMATFTKLEPKDSLIQFKTGIISDFISSMENFFNPSTEEVYKELGVFHKIGAILYGKPGTGKTCTASLIMQIAVEKYDAICLDCSKVDIRTVLDVVSKIRAIQNNPVIIFMDEVDEAIKEYENSFLTFLDGNNSLERSIFIGCTNYIDRIPERIKNRKSRIKYTFEIKSLPREVYKEFIEKKYAGIDKKELEKFAYLCEDKGLTIDQLKNALIDYRIEKTDIEIAIDSALKTS